MASELLYTSALDNNRDLIHINDAKKGHDYYCLECKEKLILRKSGNTGKGSKRPHFAHNNLTSNCTPEGVLHKGFKMDLVDLLRKYIEDQKSLIVNWICQDCGIDYSRVNVKKNIREKVVRIEEEYDLKVCRPDIALINSEDQVIGVIEIVVSHAPEENALNYFEQNGITLIQINLSSEEDLLRIEERIKYPDLVNLCINPNCSSFKHHLVNRKLKYYYKLCGNKMHKLLKFVSETSSVFGPVLSEELMESELKIAEANGVHYIKETNKVPAVRCLHCEVNNKRMRARYGRRSPRL